MIGETSKRMGAARFGHRTPGTVPGLPHPNPHGRHTEAQMAKRKRKRGSGTLSAGREEATREQLVRTTIEHVERLVFIFNDEDDPRLRTTDNKRRRYSDILGEMDAYFHKIGH